MSPQRRSLTSFTIEATRINYANQTSEWHGDLKALYSTEFQTNMATLGAFELPIQQGLQD